LSDAVGTKFLWLRKNPYSFRFDQADLLNVLNFVRLEISIQPDD